MMNEQMNQTGDSQHGHDCKCGMHKSCKCPHHKVVSVAIVLIGLVFLLQAWGMVSMETTAMIWPILLIIIGGTKLFGRMCKCC